MNEIEARLRDFLVEEGHWHAPPADLKDDLPIISTVIDSVGFVNLVAMIENEYAIEVLDEDLEFENFGTIARIAGFVARSMAQDAA
jgi:acyl carrier protein